MFFYSIFLGGDDFVGGGSFHPGADLYKSTNTILRRRRDDGDVGTWSKSNENDTSPVKPNKNSNKKNRGKDKDRVTGG